MESSKEYFDYDKDQLSLPHEIFDILSELKSKKEKEKEYEIKFRSLIEEKIVLEKQFDDLKMKIKILENDNTLKLEELTAKNLASNVSKDEKLKRQKIMLETNEHEINHLRNEICRLQLANFSTERKKNDQEKELQQMSSQLQTFAREKKEFENKFNNINEKFKKVLGEFSQLELEVKEAIQINLLYNEENKKLQSEMNKVKNSYHCTQSQLYHSNAKLKKLSFMKNVNNEDNISSHQKELKALKENNTALKDMVANKENIINEFSNQFKISQINVEKLNKIVGENSLEVKEFKEKLANKEIQLKSLLEKHENMKKLKDIEKLKHTNLEKEFFSKLKQLENQVSSLETLNNEWKREKRETQMKDHIETQQKNMDNKNNKAIDKTLAPKEDITTTDTTTTVISTDTITSAATSNDNVHRISANTVNNENNLTINIENEAENDFSNKEKAIVENDKKKRSNETNSLKEVEITESPENRITYENDHLEINERILGDGEKSEADLNKENIHFEEKNDSSSFFEKLNENERALKKNEKLRDKMKKVTEKDLDKIPSKNVANEIKICSKEDNKDGSNIEATSQNSQTHQPSTCTLPKPSKTPVLSTNNQILKDFAQKKSDAFDTGMSFVLPSTNQSSALTSVTPSPVTSMNSLAATVSSLDEQSISTHQNTLNKISEIFYSSISNISRSDKELSLTDNLETSPMQTFNQEEPQVNKKDKKGTKRLLDEDIVSRYKRTLGLKKEWKKPYLKTPEPVSTSSETKLYPSYISSLSTLWSLAKEDNDKSKVFELTGKIENHKPKSLEDYTKKSKP